MTVMSCVPCLTHDEKTPSHEVDEINQLLSEEITPTLEKLQKERSNYMRLGWETHRETHRETKGWKKVNLKARVILWFGS